MHGQQTVKKIVHSRCTAKIILYYFTKEHNLQIKKIARRQSLR